VRFLVLQKATERALNVPSEAAEDVGRVNSRLAKKCSVGHWVP